MNYIKSKMVSSEGRCSYIDISKGIGILLVVYGHLVGYRYTFDEGMHLRGFIFSFHMPLFFIISGICLYMKSKKVDLSVNLKKLVRRLIVPYLLWSLVYFLILIGIKIVKYNKIADFHTRIVNDLYDTFSLCGMAPMWFLIALFFGEILFIVTWKQFKNNNKAYIGIMVLTMILSLVFSDVCNLDRAQEISIKKDIVITTLRILPTYSFICFGYLLGVLLDRDKIKKINPFIIVTISLVLLYATDIIGKKSDNLVDLQYFMLGDYEQYYIASLLGSLGIIGIAIAINKFKPLEWMGRNSLLIMMIHYPFLSLMRIDRYIVNILPSINQTFWGSIVVLGVVVAICVLGTYIIKHNKVLNVLS